MSLDVPADGFVGILGPNGSGKTTLLRLLSGTLPPARGTVPLDGATSRAVPRTALARRMAVVPQETHLAFDYTVLEVALMGRYPHLGRSRSRVRAISPSRARRWRRPARSQLEDRLFAHAERRREAARRDRRGAGADLARPIGDAGCLLLDEPTASLDLALPVEIAALLRGCNHEHGVDHRHLDPRS